MEMLSNEQRKLLMSIARNVSSSGKQLMEAASLFATMLENIPAKNQLSMFTDKPEAVEIKYQFINDLGKEIFNGAYDNERCLPTSGSEFAAALDLRAYIVPDTAHNTIGFVLLQPGATIIIPTNLRVEIPIGYELNVYSRSGLATKGIIVANAPGIIDADYRGPVGVILHNQGFDGVKITHGDRIAQCELHKCIPTTWTFSEKLSDTARGEGGFNSTGVK